MVEPVTHISVPGFADRAATVGQKQGVSATTQDRDVPASREEADINKDKQREQRRLAALGELQDEILENAGIGGNTALRIEEDRISGRVVYSAVDKDTGEVIKQFPAEQILRSIRYLRLLTGVMVDRSA